MVPGIVYSWSWTILLDELEMYQFFAILSPSSEQKSLNALLSNCFPLLETSTLGISYLEIIFLQTKLRIFFSVIVARASTSTHLVK